MILCVPGLIEDHLAEGAPERAPWVYWLLVASGNWNGASAPGVPPSTARWWTALAAVLAVLVNNALFVVFASLAWRLVFSWRTRVQISQAFVTRDQMNKQALFSKLGTDDPDLVEKINSAFREGERNWHDNLVALFGERQTARLMEILQQQI